MSLGEMEDEQRERIAYSRGEKDEHVSERAREPNEEERESVREIIVHFAIECNDENCLLRFQQTEWVEETFAVLVVFLHCTLEFVNHFICQSLQCNTGTPGLKVMSTLDYIHSVTREETFSLTLSDNHSNDPD